MSLAGPSAARSERTRHSSSSLIKTRTSATAPRSSAVSRPTFSSRRVCTDTFCATITSTEGCTNSDCVFIDLVTSTFENPLNTQLLLFPNPTSGTIFVSVPSPLLMKSILVRNITGQIIETKKPDMNSFSIDLSSFAKGIYLLEIKTDKYAVFRKVVVE